MFMSKNEQHSYGFGTLVWAGGPRAALGTSLGLLGVSWGLLGACQGCFGDPAGHFFSQVAYLIDVLITFSGDMAPHLPLFEDIGPDAGKCSENVTTTSECIHALV